MLCLIVLVFRIYTGKTRVWEENGRISILPKWGEKVNVEDELKKAGYVKELDESFINSEWSEYKANDLPVSLKIPPKASVSERPEHHYLSVDTGKYKATFDLRVFLTNYPQNIPEYKDKEYIERLYPYDADKWMREFNNDKAELISLPNDEKAFLYEETTPPYKSYYVIYHSKGKWSWGLSFVNYGNADDALVRKYAIKIASSIKLSDLDSTTFNNYWVPKNIEPVPAN